MIKNLTLITAAMGFFAASPALMAADTAVELWAGECDFGNWSSNLVVESPEAIATLNAAKEGDKLVVELNLADEAQLKLACHTPAADEATEPAWNELAAQYDGLTSPYEFVVDADVAGLLQNCIDLYMQGKNAVVTKVTYVIVDDTPGPEKPENPEGPVVKDGLWQGSHAFNGGGFETWGNSVVIPAEVFASLATGDKVVLEYAGYNEEFQSQYLFMSGSDWAKMPGGIDNGGYFDSYWLTDGKFEFSPSAAIVASFKANGMKVDGHDGTLVKVEVIHAIPVEIPEAGGVSNVNRWTGEESLGEGWVHFPAEIFSKMPVGDNVILTVEFIDSEAPASIFFGRRDENGIQQVVNSSVAMFENFTINDANLSEGKYILMRPNQTNVEYYREYGLYLRGSNLKILRIELVPEQVPAGYASVFIHSTWWTLGWDEDTASELHPDWGKYQPGAVDDDPHNPANYFKAGMHPLHIPAAKFNKVQADDVIYIRFAWWDDEHAPEVDVYVGDMRESLVPAARAKAAASGRAATGDKIEGLTDEGVSSRKKLVFTPEVAAALKAEGLTIQGRNADIDHVRLLSKDRTTGIEGVATEAADNASAEIYTIDGRRVAEMQPGHIYIVRQGDKVSKMIAR